MTKLSPITLSLFVLSLTAAAGERISVPKHLRKIAVYITTAQQGDQLGDCGPKGCYFKGNLLDVTLDGIASGNLALTIEYRAGVDGKYSPHKYETKDAEKAQKYFDSFERFIRFINPNTSTIQHDSNSKYYSSYSHNADIECFRPVDSEEYSCDVLSYVTSY